MSGDTSKQVHKSGLVGSSLAGADYMVYPADAEASQHAVAPHEEARYRPPPTPPRLLRPPVEVAVWMVMMTVAVCSARQPLLETQAINRYVMYVNNTCCDVSIDFSHHGGSAGRGCGALVEESDVDGE